MSERSWVDQVSEAARVAALHGYGVLDVPADDELAAIVRVAAAVAGVPTATLNLIDAERQCQLTTVGFEGADSPRSDAMCDVAVAEQRAQHVPDASRDPRFADNPWVTGVLAHVRFYASVPLTTPEGHVLGTLCVFDEVEHRLSPVQMERLADCAAVVLALFERQRLARRERDVADEAQEQRDLVQLVHTQLEERHELLVTVLQTAGVGIVAADADGRLTLFNELARGWHGMDADPDVAPEDLAGTYRLFGADGSTPLREDEIPLLRALREGDVTDAEIVIAAEGQEPVAVLCTGRRLVAADGRSLGAVVVMHDVTVRRLQEAELRSSEERFRSTFEQAPTPVAVTSADGVFVDVNPAFCAWLGWSRAELVGRRAVELAHPDDLDARHAVIGAVLAGVQPSARLERRYLHRRGDWLWGRMSVGAVRDAQGGRQVITQVEDITEQRAVQRRLTDLALHDHLTGLPNRALLQDRLRHAMAVADRDGSVHALLFCDLDGFKQVNDTHGHAVGDEVLVEVAARLGDVVRPSDTAARLGGDEFVVLCESLASWLQVDGIVERLREAVERPVLTSAGELQVGVSIGVARPCGDVARSLADADRQMYEAKQRRRARPTVPGQRGVALGQP
ncbi:sensor domain-containing diguanylate cyclase [Aquipuribacter hungaricus]|uniref:Diguanylate cyclase domain-containing protein n=1 Tax=Aquipuribacter hungaricus TaxID=545624 RepID=A0ABV7WJY6_9MICO